MTCGSLFSILRATPHTATWLLPLLASWIATTVQANKIAARTPMPKLGEDLVCHPVRMSRMIFMPGDGGWGLGWRTPLSSFFLPCQG